MKLHGKKFFRVNPRKRRSRNPVAVLEDRKGRSYRYPVKRGQFKTPLELERVASRYHGQDLSFVRSMNPKKKKPRRCPSCGGIMRGPKCLTCLNPRRRKNPVLIYNPKGGVKLPATDVEIRYRRVGGKFSGGWFKHPFETSVSLFGLRDGSVLIKSNSGQRLWGKV